MTARRAAVLAVASAAAVSGCAGSSGGGGAVVTPERIAPSAPPASVTPAATPKPAADPFSPRALARRKETLAVRVTRRTPLYTSAGGKLLFHVTGKTNFNSPRGMAVLQRKGDWLGVAAEDLGNGKLAWVRRQDVQLQRVTWKIRVDLSQRRGWLLHRGSVYRAFPLGIGTDTYKTPIGRYGITDRLTGASGGAYGCCALATTAHQPNVPQDWPGGDRIALHGTPDPGSVGQKSTHGCLRADDATMRTMMAKVPIGTQIVIQQ